VKSIKSAHLIFLFLAALAVAAAGMWAFFHGSKEQAPPGPPLIALDRMGHLVTLKLNYSNVIEFLQPKTVGIPWTPWNVSLGETKGLLVAKGDCLVASDMRKAEYKNINSNNRTLAIVLPVPVPLQARINHDVKANGGSYFYVITQNGLQTLSPDLQNSTAAVNEALRRAQDDVEQTCKQSAVITMAKESTESVLRGMLLATGWTPSFVWQ
jgi:hypothetical protein